MTGDARSWRRPSRAMVRRLEHTAVGAGLLAGLLRYLASPNNPGALPRRFTSLEWMPAMRVGLPVTTITALLATAAVPLLAGRHLNPVVDLLASHKPVFGVYGPRNPRVRPGAA